MARSPSFNRSAHGRDNRGRRKRRDRAARAASWARGPGRILAANWAACFLVLMLVVFSFTGRNFLSIVNFQNVVHLQTVPFLLAAAETFVIITGGIDLSVGFVMGLASVGAAKLMQVFLAARHDRGLGHRPRRRCSSSRPRSFRGW